MTNEVEDLRPSTLIENSTKVSLEEGLPMFLKGVGMMGSTGKIPCGCKLSGDGFVSYVSSPCRQHFMEEFDGTSFMSFGIFALIGITLAAILRWLGLIPEAEKFFYGCASIIFLCSFVLSIMFPKVPGKLMFVIKFGALK